MQSSSMISWCQTPLFVRNRYWPGPRAVAASAVGLAWFISLAGTSSAGPLQKVTEPQAQAASSQEQQPGMELSASGASQMNDLGGVPTSLAKLIEEATRNNPQILAARHAWKA